MGRPKKAVEVVDAVKEPEPEAPKTDREIILDSVKIGTKVKHNALIRTRF